MKAEGLLVFCDDSRGLVLKVIAEGKQSYIETDLGQLTRLIESAAEAIRKTHDRKS